MDMKLLINEPPVQVIPSLAKAIGLNEAIVLQQLHYWLENKKNPGRMVDGEKWVYNTYEEWHENFPFWGVSTIKRIFTALEERGLIITRQFDKGKYDRTKFYRIDYAAFLSLNVPSNRPEEDARGDQLDPIDESNLTPSLNDSETTTETTTDIMGERKKVLKTTLESKSLEAAIRGNVSSEKIASLTAKEQAEKDKAAQFERAMGFNPLAWWSNADLQALLRFLMGKSEEEIRTFAAWSKNKYSSLSPAKARQYPRLVIDCWELAMPERKETTWEKQKREAQEEASKPVDEGFTLPPEAFEE